jgi:predicted enzyme related to lactoylglutathione lyase
MAPPVEGMPSFWGIYFQVADAAATVETARSRGAVILMEPMSMPEVGTMASIQDPHGAVFGVMQP